MNTELKILIFLLAVSIILMIWFVIKKATINFYAKPNKEIESVEYKETETQTNSVEQVEKQEILNEQSNAEENIEEQLKIGSITSLPSETENQKIIEDRKIFAKKVLFCSVNTQDYYNELNNKFLSFKKIKARISKRCVSYRKGRVLVAKITIRGKTLKLHLALDVKDFNKNVYFQTDLSNFVTYKDVPFAVKVKSSRGCKRAIELIDALASKFNLQRDNNYQYIDSFVALKEFIKLDNEKAQVNKTSLLNVQENICQDKTASLSFLQKIVRLEENVKGYYNAIIDKFVSMRKTTIRPSSKYTTIRHKGELIAKLTIRGKTLSLFVALNPADYDFGYYFQKDMSNVKNYAKTPCLVKIKSDRGLKRALMLIDSLVDKIGIEYKSRYTKIDAIKEIEALIGQR